MERDEALEREAIRKTLAQYTIPGDQGRVDQLVLAFTDDGVLALGDIERFAGRDQIVRGLSERMGGVRPRFMRHHLTSSRIEITGPDEARVRSYFIVFTEAGVDHAGVYADRLRRIGSEWLIAHRTVRLDWASDDSIFPADTLRALMRSENSGAGRNPDES